MRLGWKVLAFSTCLLSRDIHLFTLEKVQLDKQGNHRFSKISHRFTFLQKGSNLGWNRYKPNAEKSTGWIEVFAATLRAQKIAIS